jgi:hypothetical protein
MHILDLSRPKIEKFTKGQRKRQEQGDTRFDSTTARNFVAGPHPTDREDLPSEMAEKVFVVVTCDNPRCEQYNKIKVLQLPRLRTSSAKVDLSD